MPPVLILCGGLGTRLQGVLQGVPKVLAPIGEQCFLEYLLAYLQRQNVRDIYFALGVGAEKVLAFLDSYDAPTLTIQTFQESEPLGTLGALRFVLRQLSVLPEELVVMNGDTLIDLDLVALCEGVKAENCLMGGAAVWVEDVARYGELLISDTQRILKFKEKLESEARPGWVNGGVYYFKQALLARLLQHQGSSLERDFLQNELHQVSSWCLKHRGLFIDIGTPNSLLEARNNFNTLKAVMFSV